MKKYRVSTTISQKHWELLKKHAEKYETHQKVLEAALECMENNNSKSNPALTVEEECWLRAKWSNSVCLTPKDIFMMLVNTADLDQYREYLIKSNSITYAIEYYLRKPINKCSLREVIDVLILILRTGNAFDTVECTEDENYYTLILTHSGGLKGSKMASISYETIFTSYGAKVESVISEKTIFINIYKKVCEN